MKTGNRTALMAVGAAIAAVVAVGGVATGDAYASAGSTQLCQEQTTSVAGGAYTVQNNEWGSSQPECITTDGNAGFTVANSSISNSTSGAPGGYPSIYKGCHWGSCTQNSGLPIQESSMHSGAVISDWNTSQPGNGAYDVAYDIWYNQQPSTSGQPNGAELMIWINHNGPPEPFGSKVGTATVDGVGYDVWYGNQGWNTISYVRQNGVGSVSGLDIDDVTADAVSRGYIQPSWYLIDVEAGFELWQGGAGLATNSFDVTVNGNGGGNGGGTPPPGGSGCTATYSVTSSWSGGFQAQVVVNNTGSAATNGWTLGWTFPDGQQINNSWNGNATQSGSSVTVTNAGYNGALAAGSSATFGFTATSNSSDNTPSGVTCSAS
ncbi:MAG TPA: cellulose binding domain-containing protein [Pseudonocardiaceae bacterium]|nr:cellulose binding domain-containing protein [Pseudonocardiaceae bacterium]